VPGGSAIFLQSFAYCIKINVAIKQAFVAAFILFYFTYLFGLTTRTAYDVISAVFS